MASFRRMRGVLENVGGYRFSLGGTLTAEFLSYAEAIDMISEDIEIIIKECFVVTAEDFGLGFYEKLNGPEKTDEEPELRRDMILSLLSLGVNDNNAEGIKRFFQSLDVDCLIDENPSVQDLYIRPLRGTFSKEQRSYIRKRAENFLPCHLTFTIDFRKASWKDYDSYGKTFEEIESLGLTWEKLEEYEED